MLRRVEEGATEENVFIEPDYARENAKTKFRRRSAPGAYLWFANTCQDESRTASSSRLYAYSNASFTLITP